MGQGKSLESNSSMCHNIRCIRCNMTCLIDTSFPIPLLPNLKELLGAKQD